MRIFALTVFGLLLGAAVPVAAVASTGELQFTLGGKTYITQNAQSIVQLKNGKTRILIAVKDVTSRFMLVLSADVPSGTESQPMHLTTEDSTLSVTLRTPQGSFAVLPQIQLAKPTDLTYVERIDVDSGQLEDEPDAPGMHDAAVGHGKVRHRKKRRKIHSVYRRVKPKWHTMSVKDRRDTGEGIIENSAFKDTFFSIQLTPVLVHGKVVSYSGSFSGSGRFSRSVTSGEIKPVHNGVFNVKVDYAP